MAFHGLLGYRQPGGDLFIRVPPCHQSQNLQFTRAQVFFSGVLGLMYTVQSFASPSMGFDQVFEGFLIAFLAGMNSSPIRMGIVGLIIGEITDLTQFWVSPAYSTVIVFGILMLYVVYKSVVFRRPQYAINFRALFRQRTALKEA